MALLWHPGAGAAADATRGKYLATAGDCAACHTRAHGPAFAGGEALRSGPNIIYSMNITPDRATGIGGWSADAFYRALHDGISPTHGHLYPAFPYPHFRLVSRADSDDILAYLRTLKPVHASPPPDRVMFPLSIRAGMIAWNALYLGRIAYRPDPTRSAQWNRGALLVRGLEHCGDCHTPRNLLFAEETGRQLHGATVEGWFAPDLTPVPRSGLGDWSAADIVQFLKTGRNSHEWAVGTMREVIADSTSRLSDADVAAIAAYLKSMRRKASVMPAGPPARTMQEGKIVYALRCSACHGDDGRARLYPSLAGNTLVQASNPATVLRVIRHGSQSLQPPQGSPGFSMPGFSTLSNRDIAAVATYIRNAWGNRGSTVRPSDVSSAP